MKDKISIESLYFGIKLFSISYVGDAERQELKTYNLFDSSRVKSSVAMWVTEKVYHHEHDFLSFCFGDTRSRCEYEWMVAPFPPGKDDKPKKVDVYTMYVEPNAELLKDMVDRVSVSSARRYLRDWRKGRI